MRRLEGEQWATEYKLMGGTNTPWPRRWGLRAAIVGAASSGGHAEPSVDISPPSACPSPELPVTAAREPTTDPL